jgi:hypothetical protein
LPSKYLHTFVKYHELRGTVIGGQDTALPLAMISLLHLTALNSPYREILAKHTYTKTSRDEKTH